MFFEQRDFIHNIHGLEKYFLRLSILKVFPSYRNEQRHPFHMLYKKGNALYPFLISFPTKSFLICCGLMSRHVNTSCMWLHKFLTFYGCVLFTIIFLDFYIFSRFFSSPKKANLWANKLIFCKKSFLVLFGSYKGLFCIKLFCWVIANLSSGVHAFNV